jgi:hypothetical protein
MFPHVIGQATIATRPTGDACDSDTYDVARAVLGTSKTASCRWVAQTSLYKPFCRLQSLEYKVSCYSA